MTVGRRILEFTARCFEKALVEAIGRWLFGIGVGIAVAPASTLFEGLPPTVGAIGLATLTLGVLLVVIRSGASRFVRKLDAPSAERIRQALPEARVLTKESHASWAVWFGRRSPGGFGMSAEVVKRTREFVGPAVEAERLHRSEKASPPARRRTG